MNPEKVIQIHGGKCLKGGKLPIAGSSNQVTKCIIAALLTDEDVIIDNAPDVDERRIVEDLFTTLGGKISRIEKHAIRLNAKEVHQTEIPIEQCQRNRISILACGPLLHRFREVSLFKSLGGDRIGKRPVNFHIEGLTMMGANVEEQDDRYLITVGEEGLHGAHIELAFPSVMTTENLLITATKARGRTVIKNAAIEPEIIELTKMLQKMGADITWDANRTYIVEGVEKLKGCEIRCLIDRNQAVSFAAAAIATGGNVFLEKIPHASVYTFLNFIQRMGAEFKINAEGLYVSAPKTRPLSATHIEVDVHPGFMTDWQQPFMVLFTQAKGTSILHETVFEERLSYTNYLNAMGANIALTSKCLGELPCRYRNCNFIHSAIIQGPTPLFAQDFTLPTDIRAGMCLVISALVAEGTTHLTNIQELHRKYDNLVPKLQAMGADLSIK